MNDGMDMELGLAEDRQLITGCHCIFTANNYARNLCKEYIPDGDRFFDVISRYADLCTCILARDSNKCKPALKMIVPFLVSFGVSDHAAFEFSKKNIRLLKGAKDAINYLYRLLPIFVSTCSSEHNMMAVSEATGFPMTHIGCPRPSFDSLEINRQEMRILREFARELSNLKVSDVIYTDATFAVDDDDVILINKCENIFLDKFPKMEFYEDYNKLESIGIDEKSYTLLEIRKKTEIELSSTIYVGGDITDVDALDIVRDSSGLAISFNGNCYAVHACNVAVMTDDTTVLSVLAEEFYDGGIESVFALIDDWTPAKLRKRPMDENSPLKKLLKTYPKKLPVVKKVDRHNVKEISELSEKFRRKLVC